MSQCTTVNSFFKTKVAVLQWLQCKQLAHNVLQLIYYCNCVITCEIGTWVPKRNLFVNMYLFAVLGPVEADPEYQLIVDSNNMVVELDNEISKLLL